MRPCKDRILAPHVGSLPWPQDLLDLLEAKETGETGGRERAIASTDCGFATFAGPNNPVIESIAREKPKAPSVGAGLASEQLW